MTPKPRTTGEKFRPTATVLKTSGGKPTVLEIGGNRYILDNRAENTRHRRKKFENLTGLKAAQKRRRIE